MFALLIGTIAVEKTNINPVYPAAVVFAIGLAVSFTRKIEKNSSGAYLVKQADLFNPSQLQIKDIIKEGIRQHYGEREVPKFLDKMRIVRKDLFHIQYLTPTIDAFSFFNGAQPANFFSNFKEASLTGNKMYVIGGIQAELATGAAAADTTDILDFKTPVAGTDEEVLNGFIFWKCNTIQELEYNLYKGLFLNDDGMKNFWRSPRLIVWEPQNQMEMQIRLCKAYAAGVHKFLKLSLMGYELTR
jgi:hypothetical protein